MKNCLHCGKPLEDWETVCSVCGTPVIVPEQTKVCPSCGKVVFQEALKVKLEGQVVCPKCEKPITFE